MSFNNLYVESKLQDAPAVVVRPSASFPSQSDVDQFAKEFAQAPNPKSWLEDQGVGENYSTNIADADFVQAFAQLFVADTVKWMREPIGEKFYELMWDLCELAQRAGNR